MRKYIDRIVENGRPEDMECLSEMLVDLLYKLKETDHELFEKYKTKLKGMAYDYIIDEELAKEIVSNMKPLGEFWNMETIRTVTEMDAHNLWDKYVVMNSLVNDYQYVVSPDNTETYIGMTTAWLDDVDGRDHKVWWYFVK